MIKSCIGRSEFRFVRWHSNDRIDARRVSDGLLFREVPPCTFREDTPGEIEGEVRRLRELYAIGQIKKPIGG